MDFAIKLIYFPHKFFSIIYHFHILLSDSIISLWFLIQTAEKSWKFQCLFSKFQFSKSTIFPISCYELDNIPLMRYGIGNQRTRLCLTWINCVWKKSVDKEALIEWQSRDFRRDMTWHDMTWRDVTWADVTWRDMTWHDVAWRYMTWSRGMTWHDVTWRDMTWHEVTWCGMTWYDVAWRSMTNFWGLSNMVAQ